MPSETLLPKFENYLLGCTEGIRQIGVIGYLITSTSISFLVTDDNQLHTNGVIVRIDPGAGIAIQFVTTGRTGREQLKRFMQFVENKTNHADQRYLAHLTKG